jgi:hypothetical protein
MKNIKLLKKNISDLIEECKFVNIKISIGSINENGVMNHKINSRSFDIYHAFIKNKIKNSKHHNITEYYHNDLKQISYQDKDKSRSIFIQKLPTIYLNYKLTDSKKNINTSHLRVELINNRKIDALLFPSLEQYNDIVKSDIYVYASKYKNSEIEIKFINSGYGNVEINFISKIDKVNIENFINNFEYILSKFYFCNVKL